MRYRVCVEYTPLKFQGRGVQFCLSDICSQQHVNYNGYPQKIFHNHQYDCSLKGLSYVHQNIPLLPQNFHIMVVETWLLLLSTIFATGSLP